MFQSISGIYSNSTQQFRTWPIELQIHLNILLAQENSTQHIPPHCSKKTHNIEMGMGIPCKVEGASVAGGDGDTPTPSPSRDRRWMERCSSSPSLGLGLRMTFSLSCPSPAAAGGWREGVGKRGGGRGRGREAERGGGRRRPACSPLEAGDSPVRE